MAEVKPGVGSLVLVCQKLENPSPPQAAAGLKLYYKNEVQGKAAEQVDIGTPSTGSLQTTCDLDASDVVYAGGNFNNGRCNGSSECRWGKLEL